MTKAKMLVSCNYSICDLSITVENSHGDTTIIEPPPKYKDGLNVDDYIKELKEWENEKLARTL
jgi:hypothetical protein